MQPRAASGLAAILVMAAAAAACGGSGYESPKPAAQAQQPAAPKPASPEGASRVQALAKIQGLGDSGVNGQATFRQEGGTVILKLGLEHVPPGSHAVHIHETGDCSAPDGSSAGGHWNPTHEDHGKWDQAPFHLGDIGNIEIDGIGRGTLTLTTDRWSIGTGAPNDVVGHSVIVHAAVDDFTTQPTGNAGGRIGCGVIALD